MSKWVPAIVAGVLMAGTTLAQDYQTQVLAAGLEHPWSLAFLDDRRMLVTERPGRLRLIEDGQLLEAPVEGVPEVFASGQAGLFDVLPAPDHAQSGVLHLSFAHGNADANAVRIVRARLQGNRLVDVRPVFTAEPPKSGDAHYGARMAILEDGSLLMGTGDGFYFREQSQALDSHLGKIVRIRPEGGAPPDNPLLGQAGVLPEIYSYGHRNVQAIVVVHGRIYAHEHGPRGGDELNLILPGRNYGWPVISYGRDYSRALITPFVERDGMEQPVLHWTPSIAPAGMAYYDGALLPQWRNSLLVAALAEKSVRRLPLGQSGYPGEQEVLFRELGQRMRDVRVAQDGSVYLLTDEADGQLLRVVPADPRPSQPPS